MSENVSVLANVKHVIHETDVHSLERKMFRKAAVSICGPPRCHCLYFTEDSKNE